MIVRLARLESFLNRAPVRLSIQIDDTLIGTSPGMLPIDVVIDYPIDPPVSARFTIPIKVNTQDGSVSFMNLSTIPVVPLVFCLAGCGLSAIIGPLIRCLPQSSDPQQILQCLLAEGANIASSAIPCALGCLNLGVPSQS